MTFVTSENLELIYTIKHKDITEANDKKQKVDRVKDLIHRGRRPQNFQSVELGLNVEVTI